MNVNREYTLNLMVEYLSISSLHKREDEVRHLPFTQQESDGIFDIYRKRLEIIELEMKIAQMIQPNHSEIYFP